MDANLKGVVLAAGLGTRLRPVTELYPKPLVPLVGATPLDLALWRLEAAGVADHAINTDHASGRLAAFVDEHRLRSSIRLSHEPALLGTGGVYNPLRRWQGGCDLVVLNGDVIADFDLPALIACHRRTGAIATMALLPNVIAGESAVHFTEGRVVSIGRTAPAAAVQAGNFACAQLLTPAFLDLLPKAGTFDIISAGYQVALARHLPVAAYIHTGIWHDLRTPDFYWEAVRDLVIRPGALARLGIEACRDQRELVTTRREGVIFDSTSTFGANVNMTKMVVVEPGCRIGQNAVLEDCLLLPGTVVGAGVTERQMILGPGLRLPIQSPIQTSS